MNTTQTLVIVVAVNRIVENVLFSEFLHHLLYVGHALGTFAHSLCGVVDVAARAVPVREKLGSKRNIHDEGLNNSREEVTGHVKVAPNFDTSAGSNLVLPLTRHDLSIGARDFDACVVTGLVVSVGNEATEAHGDASGAVIGPCCPGYPLLGHPRGGWKTF